MNSSWKNPTILIVDDEPNNIRVLGESLGPFGYDMMMATSGAQALERIEARVPDLVLLDIRMEDMDGFETCKRIRENPSSSDVPIIFLSADNDKNTIVKALETGGVDYVSKPFNKAELLARVRTHLELKFNRDERGELLARTERFLESMAHDLKNWIGSASLSAQLMNEVKEMPEKAVPLVKNVNNSLEQSLDFIKKTLANAREAKTEIEVVKEDVSLPGLCTELTERYLSNSARKGIIVEFESDGDVLVYSDRTALRRILDNLISNAIKFSPRDAKIRVTCSSEAPQFVIVDQGPGFSEEDLKKVFEAYTRLSAKPTAGEPSTGLGLSIVKQLCDLLDIEIEIVSEGGEGSEIRLSFPRGGD
ncbi:MAG: hybrid sensor histidine kinase/response regulator [Verrucomicrobiales bacterium]|nr:hybrid sensor histidine kinase/response regulator [Verrucomicrobiales bacterium]